MIGIYFWKITFPFYIGQPIIFGTLLNSPFTLLSEIITLTLNIYSVILNIDQFRMIDDENQYKKSIWKTLHLLLVRSESCLNVP
ncbi:MAG: hypothetical protein DRN27_10060 [Thermoplasmata archaeon]|nr:MAG: hypothetical protein DRN27_10060 [Thermoplasmata archaeon]